MYEFQVSLSLPSEAQTVADAVREFKWDVENGPDYVYRVDDGEHLWDYDAETGEATEVPRTDMGVIRIVARRVFEIAHEMDPDTVSDIHRSQYDEELTEKIAGELAALYRMV